MTSCAHVTNAHRDALSILTNLPSYLKSPSVPTKQCSSCHESLARPLVCTTCAATMCLRKSCEHDHPIYYDLRSEAVYCSMCDAYILSEPSPADGSKARQVDPPIPRGLWNLGQTCFMSVVLQAFLHNPILSNYFLSDKHNRFLCARSNGPVPSTSTSTIFEDPQEEAKPCLSCQMDLLFSDYFTTPASTAPIGPIHFLQAMWQTSASLAGDAQQDAHEFLISALNNIHTTLFRLPQDSGKKDSECRCIIHQTFSGVTDSAVSCKECSNISHSEELMFDLSLDLSGAPTSILSCLQRFTTPEELPSKTYACPKCLGKAQKGAIKTLSIKRLPPVLCIQLKRFEHSISAQKIDTFVRFPLVLNMKPYTLASSTASLPDSMFEYELTWVINHLDSKINSGHYVAYGRVGEEWYSFDDDKVIKASLAHVLQSKAYILVYSHRQLDRRVGGFSL